MPGSVTEVHGALSKPTRETSSGMRSPSSRIARNASIAITLSEAMIAVTALGPVISSVTIRPMPSTPAPRRTSASGSGTPAARSADAYPRTRSSITDDTRLGRKVSPSSCQTARGAIGSGSTRVDTYAMRRCPASSSTCVNRAAPSRLAATTASASNPCTRRSKNTTGRPAPAIPS